jgi:exodeoxyribonuclease V alpha subunit
MKRARTTSHAALPLHPLGTARQRLHPAPALPAEVARALDDADLGEEAAFVAWQVTSWAEGASAADREQLAAAVAASLIAVAQGSTRTPVTPAARAALARVTGVVGAPGARTPFVLDGEHLYQHRHHACEARVVAALRARLGRAAAWPTAGVAAAVAEVAASASPPITAEQQAAVEAALARAFTPISGGPGTGKTTVAFSLVRALVRLGVAPGDIALAAPTGKAANRLDEAIKGGLRALAAGSPGDGPDAALAQAPPAAETLHRLLGYSAARHDFASDSDAPLPHRAVIVDEGSMIDLQLMDRLLRALRPDAALVLLGDADQLPSVEAGAVFRDLASRGVRLTRSHRQDAAAPRGQQILALAQAIRRGDPGAGALLTTRAAANALDFGGAELLPAAGPDAPEALEAFLVRWYEDRLLALPGFDELAARVYPLGEAGFTAADGACLDTLYAHHQGFRLLAVTRARPTGVEALNAWLHARYAPGPARFAAGEPVMMLHNDYERGLWNGDQGLVVRVREPDRSPRLAAAFKSNGRWVAWHLASLGDSLTLAHALTVHKAQGSEYDDVALVLPEAPLPLVTRELLYTALTRSRRSFVLCGPPAVLAAGVATTAARQSGVAEKL